MLESLSWWQFTGEQLQTQHLNLSRGRGTAVSCRTKQFDSQTLKQPHFYMLPCSPMGGFCKVSTLMIKPQRVSKERTRGEKWDVLLITMFFVFITMFCQKAAAVNQSQQQDSRKYGCLYGEMHHHTLQEGWMTRDLLGLNVEMLPPTPKMNMSITNIWSL